MIKYPSAIKIIIHLLLIVCIHHQWGIIKHGKKIALDVPYIGAVFVHTANNVLDGMHVILLKYKVSLGIPRMINRICDKSLMYAYQQQKNKCGHCFL